MKNSKTIDMVGVIANEYANTKLSVYEVETSDFGLKTFDETTISSIAKSIEICLGEMNFNAKVDATIIDDETALIEIA